MEDYRSNSNRSREQNSQPSVPKRAEKVTTGTVSQRKKGVAEKLLGSVISNDAGDIGEYIIYDVLIPALKRAFYDAICNGTGMLLGERNPSRGGGPANKVSYRSYYDRQDDNKRSNAGGRANSSYSYNDLVFRNRGDAEVVLERMYELLDHFDAVSVADLFDLAGESCNYTDNKYGWTNLNDAYVKPVNGGYMIQLPRATTL